MSKKEDAFRLFNEGKRPSDPEVRVLGLSPKTRYNYFQLFKKGKGKTISKLGDGDKLAATPEEKRGYKVTDNPEEASVFVFTPRKYEINSIIPLIAKHVCETEWNWPKMSMTDFLDTYFFYTMKQRGIVIGAYQKIEDEKGKTGS